MRFNLEDRTDWQKMAHLLKIDQLSQVWKDTGSSQDALALLKALRTSDLFNVGIILGREMCKLYSSTEILDELGICQYYAAVKASPPLSAQAITDGCREAFESFETARTSTLDVADRSHLVDNAGFCLPHITNQYTSKVPTVLKLSPVTPLVTVTMTSCKRLELFKATVNSFYECCLDRDLIKEWICIDDNSSDADRVEMQRLYPFIQFIMKPHSAKGHSQSMNLVRDLATTPYIFHLEDDFNFFIKRRYLTAAIRILDDHPSIGQVLINRNYAETYADHSTVGGVSKHLNPALGMGSHFFLHEYCPTEGEKRAFERRHSRDGRLGHNAAYWPHFSLRPSLIRRQALIKVGSFNDSTSHFEMEYANRWVAAGWTSAFFDGVFCIHTGRLTTQCSDEERARIPNAYDLNHVPQFGRALPDVLPTTRHSGGRPVDHSESLPESLPTLPESPEEVALSDSIAPRWCVNLDRRPDRWIKFSKQLSPLYPVTRFPAVDGRSVRPSARLDSLFGVGDYDLHAGIIGCALSHLQLTIKAVYGTDPRGLVIFEDDAELCPNFWVELKDLTAAVSGTDWDLIYLGHVERVKAAQEPDGKRAIKQVLSAESLRISAGGTFAYMLSKKGACKLLQFIESRGMTNAIDTMQQLASDVMNVYYVLPPLVTAQTQDTDIQRTTVKVPASTEPLTKIRLLVNGKWDANLN